MPVPGPHRGAAHDPGGPLVVIEVDVVRDVQPDDLGVLVDADRAKGPGVRGTRPEQQLHEHGIVRSDLVELLAGERAPVVAELVWRVAAEDHDPPARAELARALGDQAPGLLTAVHAVEANVAGPLPRAADDVHVIVDEARNDRLLLQIDHAGARVDVAADLPIGADGQDAAVTHGKRLVNREALVDGDDAAVRHHQVGGLGGRGQHRQQ